MPFKGKYFNKKSIASKEEKNAETRPAIRGKKLNKNRLFKEVKSSTIAAMQIEGKPKRNENFIASLFSHPDNNAVDIVTPDLETPGKIANA